jgi:hypothetical protein
LNALPDPITELEAGIAFWRTRVGAAWPADFHSADYLAWSNDSPDFSDEWWTPFLRRLRAWGAIRPDTYAELTERFTEQREALSLSWAQHCDPYRNQDITGVTWIQVGGFADLAGEIKPMKGLPSPVFTSKFCHLLLPKIFPIVDNGPGNRWLRYEEYFSYVQSLWASTPEDMKTGLVERMTGAVESTGSKISPAFPMVDKILELQMMGQHPVSVLR